MQALEAAQFHVLRRVVRQVGGGRARAARVDERERGVETDVLDQLHGLFEVFFGFAGKAHDEVRRQGQVRARRAQAPHHRLEFQRGVAALHAGQHAVAAGLHGQVQKRHQLGQAGVGVHHALGHFLGVRGRVADAFDAGDFVHVLQQHGEVGDLVRAFHLAAVGVHVLAQQRHFLHALVGQVGHFDQHVLERARDFLAARVRHDAEAAVLATALHDGHERGGAVNARGRHVVELFDFREADVHLRTAFGTAARDQVGQAVQRLRPEHHVDIGRALDDGGAFLAGHAATHADHQVRIGLLQVLHPAQVRKHFFLRLFTHRTGVEQDDVGLFRVVGQLQALVAAQHVGHLVRVVLVHLAAEGADVQLAGGTGAGVSGGGVKNGRGGGAVAGRVAALEGGSLHVGRRDGCRSRGLQ
ncbi:hypothetical protein D3C72_1282230 [compost metagenome]